MTELDFTILAIIARDGPLSAYDVRKVFAQSLTPTWSSSTGSIYPSIGRLEKMDMVTASAPQGGRSRKLVSATAEGKRRLSAWLADIDASTASATPDAIRTRMFFLALASAADRRDIISAAVRSTEIALSTAEQTRLARPPSQGTDWARYASMGVIYQLRARLDWLRWLAQESGIH
ncbi:MAG: PadR family transcriptional regulator [Brevundimonas sp.]